MAATEVSVEEEIKQTQLRLMQLRFVNQKFPDAREFYNKSYISVQAVNYCTSVEFCYDANGQFFFRPFLILQQRIGKDRKVTNELKIYGDLTINVSSKKMMDLFNHSFGKTKGLDKLHPMIKEMIGEALLAKEQASIIKTPKILGTSASKPLQTSR